MSGVPEAVDALRAALLKNSVQHHAWESFNHLASCLVLLNSSSPSVQMIRRLCSVLRKPLLPLYNACLRPTLQLASSILSAVLGKVCDNAEDDKLRTAWDETAKVVLSGVLDFLDQKYSDNIESDCVVWEVLYRIICDFFFLDSGRALPEFSIRLCLSAYNTLIETAARQPNIGNALRDKAVLGGERLGAAISRTRDYLLLEALLVLFARLLPPIQNNSQGKVRRAKFVKEVLGSSKLFKCNGELLDIMNKTGKQWDDVAAQIVDALARTDVTYPQPFSIDEIAVCGRVFPQPLATDRLVMDKQAFLVNIIAESDDPCESLQIPYSSIRTITINTSGGQDVPKGKTSIVVYLTSPPSVADLEMKSPNGSQLHAKFLLQNDAVSRFMEALRRRGVGKLSFLNPSTRVKGQRTNISIGSGFKFTNDSSPVPLTASFEGKVQHVNQVYKTDIEESATSKAVFTPRIGDPVASPTPDPKLLLRDEKLIPEVRQLAVAEDVSATTTVTFNSPINSTSKLTQKLVLPFPEENLITAVQPFGDDSELSEISDFEPENDMIKGRIATAVSASREYRFKPTRRRFGRTRVNGISVTTSTPQTSGRTGGVAQRPLEIGKSLLVSDSPTFGSSSATQINGSPKPSSNAESLAPAGTESPSRLFIISQDFASTNVDDRSPVNIEPIVTSVGKGFTSTEDGAGEHSRFFTPSSANHQETHPSTKAMGLTSTPPKIAGSRRKREIVIKPSSEAVIELDDISMPPHKKSRSNRIKEDNVKPKGTPLDTDSASGMKKCTKMTNSRSTGIDPTIVLVDEFSDLKPARQETRRSSRIKKRQPAGTGGTWASTTRGNAQKLKRADGQSTCTESGTAPLQDINIKISSITPLNPTLQPIPTSDESPVKIDSHLTLVELRSAEHITPEAIVSQQVLKATSARESTKLSITPFKESRRNLESNQKTASDEIQFVQPRFDIKAEESVGNRQIMCDIHAMDDIGQDNEVTAHPLSSVEREDISKLSLPAVQCTPRTQPVTIDLTLSGSPDREERNLCKTSVSALARPEADLQAKVIRTSDQSEYVPVEEPPIAPSSRHRCRSVTFASPIEYVLEKKFKSQKAFSTSSHRFPLSPESNSFSPLISSGTVSKRRESPDRVMPQATLEKTKRLQGHKTSIHHRVSDEVGIQDIVEVLNEIQAVIVKGISDKFKNVRKDVQQGREELIRQVLDELRCTVVENEKYLNALVRLEEDYYTSGRTITRCWEELIDCNDAAVTRSQNVLKEYNQNASARMLPKSLLFLKPVFRRRHANA